MARKKTKKEKIQIQQKIASGEHTAQSLYQFSGFSSSKVEVKNTKKKVDSQSFFGYDIHLIYKDLIRTGVVASIVVGVLLLILVYT